MAGSNIRSGHLHGSGYITNYRALVKALDLVGTTSAGILDIWDTDSAPIQATYGRSGTTVTVTKVGHGLSTGDKVGITFLTTSGAIATPGNYVITVTGVDTFTITDINSGTIAAGKTCYYVNSTADGYDAQWLASWHTSANDTFFNGFNMPDEGMLARIGIYIRVENLASVNIYYIGA